MCIVLLSALIEAKEIEIAKRQWSPPYPFVVDFLFGEHVVDPSPLFSRLHSAPGHLV